MGKILVNVKRRHDEIDTVNNGSFSDNHDSDENRRKKHKKTHKDDNGAYTAISTTTPSKIHLRHDQYSKYIRTSSSQNVTVYAPIWIKKALRSLAEESKLYEHPFEIIERGYRVIDKIQLQAEISLQQLQMIARNEPRNSTGAIDLENYSQEIPDKYILSLKDLARQTVIIGLDSTTAAGGYKCQRVDQNIKVAVIDLSALEFRKPWNTGRLVLYAEDEDRFPKGYLDDDIFYQVCNEHRNSISNVRSDRSGRYVEYPDGIYFDTVAYKKFVAYDILYIGLALEDFAKKHNLVIHFKFLAYGTGHFAGIFKKVLNENLIPGILDGLEQLFSGAYGDIRHIHNVELPFYDRYATHDPSIKPRINSLCKDCHVDVWFSNSDALENTIPALFKKYTIATTNCANPHAVLGNCMTHNSIDGSIAENLESRGNIFSPVLNKEMGSKWLKVELKEKEEFKNVRSEHRRSRSQSKSKVNEKELEHRHSRSESKSKEMEPEHRLSQSKSKSKDKKSEHRHSRSQSKSKDNEKESEHRHSRSESKSKEMEPEHRLSRSKSKSKDKKSKHRHSRSISKTKDKKSKHRESRSKSRSKHKKSKKHRDSSSRSQSKPKSKKSKKDKEKKSKSKKVKRSRKNGNGCSEGEIVSDSDYSGPRPK